MLALALLLPGALHAGDDTAAKAAAPVNHAAQPCSDHETSFPSCGVSSADRQKAEALYKQAIKLARRNRYDEALEKLNAARAISARDIVYASTGQALKQKVVANQLRLGDQATQAGDANEALAAFRRAVELDPDNEYAAQRLHEALPPAPAAANAGSALPALEAEMGELHLAPEPGVHSFEFRGPSSAAMEKFAALFGIATVADQGLASINVRIKLDNVDWQTGSQILQKVCKVLVIPMSRRQVLLATDSEENRRYLTRMSLRTFYFQGGTLPQQLTDLTTALRVLFDLRFITPNPANGTLVVRAPQTTMDAVARFLDDMQDDRPTVMLEIKVFEVSTVLTKDLGTSVPNQFTVFSVPSEIQKLVGGSSFQQIVAALQASGQSVNATTIIAALLASSSSSSPLASPFATFGGGLSLSAITLSASSLHLSGTDSLSRTVDDVLLRTEHGNPATLKVGERYPIVSSQFSATTATSSLLSTLGVNSSALAAATTSAAIPSPQFSYEDLGIVLKATPQVQGKLITLDYELTLRALGPTLSNGLPILTNREMKGFISTGDGESIVIAGLMSKGEMESINGFPLISAVPVLGQALSVDTKQKTSDELLIVMTPHVTSERRSHGLCLPLPTNVPK